MADGRCSLRADGRELVSGASVVIAAPGWRGSVSQSACRFDEGYPRQADGTCSFRGQLVEAASGSTWRFEQRIAPTENGVKVTYVVTPTADVTIGEICVFLDLPVSEWSGKRLLLWPMTAGTFPPEPPAQRHFMSGPTRKAVLGGPGPGQLTISFAKPAQCTAQDGREFGQQRYQVYPRLSTGGRIEAGRECRLEMELIPGDDTPYDVLGTQLRSEGRPVIGEVSASSDTVPQYGKLELSFGAGGTWENPFDPSQVAIDAHIAGPDGRSWAAPAFFHQGYERLPSDGVEMLMPTGSPDWRVRFSPPVVGTYRYSLTMENQGKTVRTPEMTFRCVADPSRHGYLRVSERNPHYFRFDDGTPFFAVGMNVATLGSGGTASAERWYTRLAGAGGNFVRSWWCSGGTDLESEVTNRPDQGIGKLKLDQAWRIDRLVDLAEDRGIHIMACIETQQYLRRNAWWQRYTYNAANGGPVSEPADFFVNDEADEFFRRRLRYIVARWSYSTAIAGWQFWNEVSACDDFDPDNASAWHRRMARYLRSVDPVDHIIHTNFGNLDGYEEVDGLPEMEIVSTNIYSRRDMAQTGYWGARWMTGRYAKPFLLTEYGVGHRGGWVAEDPDGVIVHNGLWGPIMGGAAGTGLPWGWSHWIDPQDMYGYWEPVSQLVKGVPFHLRTWQPVDVAELAFRHPGRAPYYADVFVEGWPRNYNYTTVPDPRPEVFHIDANGELVEEKSLRADLWGGQSHVLQAQFPVDGSLVVHLPEIWDRGEPVLEVSVDGQAVLEQELPRDTEQAWAYWKSYEVAVPAGEHTLTVRNGGSGAFWTGYELRKFRRREGPDLDVVGIQCEDHILLWLRNPQFIWIYAREGRHPEAREAGVLTLSDVNDGRYSVTWWETTTGEVLAEGHVEANNGKIEIPTPAITRSAAAKMVKAP
jgi:hypothetical protein